MSPSAEAEANIELTFYNNELRKGLQEKLWFLDKVGDVASVVDFGCGDGSLLEAVRRQQPWLHLGGYDVNPRQCGVASYRSDAASITDKFLEFVEWAREAPKPRVLVLSSVMHEVISQERNWITTWNALLRIGCEWVAVRDMALDRSVPMERRWAIEFALKSPWLKGAGADREASENYFPLLAEDWVGLGWREPKSYRIAHVDHHSVPWIREHRGVHERTHFKMLLTR